VLNETTVELVEHVCMHGPPSMLGMDAGAGPKSVLDIQSPGDVPESMVGSEMYSCLGLCGLVHAAPRCVAFFGTHVLAPELADLDSS
jgi:hypothetical protein